MLVKVLKAVRLVGGEARRVHHGRVREAGAVLAREQAKGELGLVDHRREHQARRAPSRPRRPDRLADLVQGFGGTARSSGEV